MNEIKVKSNGLRNELKEIRKSIDKLTQTAQRQTETFDHIADTLSKLLVQLQTNTQNENNNNTTCCNDVKLCKCKGKKPNKVQEAD